MYRPLLTEVPATPDDWWVVLFRLAGTWYGVELQQRRVGDAERRRLGAASGLDVSPVFDEWASFHTELDVAGIFGRAMRDDYALDWHPELASITLLIQGERDLYWSVDAEHVGERDPPVVTWLLDYDASTETWERFKPWSPSTTGFVLHHLLSYLWGSVAGLSTTVPSLENADALLLPLVDNRVELDGQVVYEGVDLLAVAERPPWSDEEETRLSIEMGGSWKGRIPRDLAAFAASAGGMHHGDL